MCWVAHLDKGSTATDAGPRQCCYTWKRLNWCCRLCVGVGVGWELVGRVSDMLGVRCGEAVVSRGGMEFG